MGRRDGAGAGDGWAVVTGMVEWGGVGVSAGSGGAGGEQLGQVMGGADQRPLGLDPVEPAQEELAEAAGVLDLADHRLDGLLAQPVARAPAGAPEPGGHRGHPRAGLEPAAAARVGTAVGSAAGGEIAPDATLGERFEVALPAE